MITFTKLCIEIRKEIQNNGKAKTRARSKHFLKSLEKNTDLKDKEFFKSTDFAWTFDKVTSKLSSIVLSVGLGIENTKKIPNTMSCIQKIFYY